MSQDFGQYGDEMSAQGKGTNILKDSGAQLREFRISS